MNGMGPFRNAGRSGRRRSAIHRCVAFAAALVVAAGLFVAGARPAEAIGVWVHRVCHKVTNPYAYFEWADFCVGFDYSGVTNGNRLRAYAKVVTRTPFEQIDDIVWIDWVRLGDGNGVISQSGSAGDFYGSVELNTPLNYQCHRLSGSWYNARARFHVLWQNGGSSAWDFFVYYWRSVDSVDGTCSDVDRTYYYSGNPFPPGYVATDFGFLTHTPSP